MYGFQANGNGVCGWKHKYLGNLFGKSHKHDRYPVENSIDPRLHVSLAFLAPILSPEKPCMLRVGLAKTIMGAYSGEREVDEGVVIRYIVQKLVGNINMTRPSPLAPILYHLYRKDEVLTKRRTTRLKWMRHYRGSRTPKKMNKKERRFHQIQTTMRMD